MKKILIPIILASFVAGCSTTTLNKINTTLDTYDQAIQNFNNASARINSSIALTSKSLAGYCQDAKAAGQNLTTIVNGNDTALTALQKVTAGLNTYCAAPPQDVGGAIVSLTAIIAAAKQAGG